MDVLEGDEMHIASRAADVLQSGESRSNRSGASHRDDGQPLLHVTRPATCANYGCSQSVDISQIRCDWNVPHLFLVVFPDLTVPLESEAFMN